MTHWYGHDANELAEVVRGASPALRRCAQCNRSNARSVVALTSPLVCTSVSGGGGDQVQHLNAVLLCGDQVCTRAFQQNVTALHRVASALGTTTTGDDGTAQQQQQQQQRAALVSLVNGPSTQWKRAPSTLPAIATLTSASGTPPDTFTAAAAAADDDATLSMPGAMPLTSLLLQQQPQQPDVDSFAPVAETLSGTVRRQAAALFGDVAWDERLTRRTFEPLTTVLTYIDRDPRLAAIRQLLAAAGKPGRDLFDLRVHTLTRIALFVPTDSATATSDGGVPTAASALETLQSWTVYSPIAIPYSALDSTDSRIEMRSTNNRPITVRLVTDSSAANRGALQARLDIAGQQQQQQQYTNIAEVITLANGQISLLQQQ